MGTQVVSEREIPHIYEIRPGQGKSGFYLQSDTMQFGRVWYIHLPHAIGFAKFYSRSHPAVIRVYDTAGNVIESHGHKGDPETTIKHVSHA
jgi:hypothetical protein